MFMFLLDQKCVGSVACDSLVDLKDEKWYNLLRQINFGVGSVACDSLVDLKDEKWYNLLRQINFGVGSGGFYKNDFLGVAISKEIGNSLYILWVIFIPNG
jgi:hypothetical protein